MTNQKKLIRRAAMTAAAIALLIPVTVSPNQGVAANNACADGGCCKELMSVCVTSDSTGMSNYYKDSDGICGMQEQH